MNRHTMLQQYDQATRDQIVKRRNVLQRYERIFKDDGDLPDDVPDDDRELPDDVVDDDRQDDDDDGENAECLDGDSDSDNGNGGQRHVVDELADLLVEGGSPD